MNKIAKGVWPTMITPFTREGNIDEAAVAALINWYVAKGCDGVFAVCQSSEMFHLSLPERVQLAKLCVDHAADRIEVIASGHISDDATAQLEEIRAISQTGVRAVVLVTNRFAREDEDDEIWIERAQALTEKLPGVTFGLYECPYPYKRLLTKRTLSWVARSGRFAFMKDTCCNARLIRERLQTIRENTPAGATQMGLYNANSMTILDSLRAGASGFSGVMANLHPELYKWLCAHYAKDPMRAEEMQALLTLLSGLEGQAYPVCAKAHMRSLGVDMNLDSRCISASSFGYAQQETLRQAEIVERLARRLFLHADTASKVWSSGRKSDLIRWTPTSPYPAEPAEPIGLQRSLIHRADDEYPFLHDTMIASLNGRLFCAWYACTTGEIEGRTTIRGRWSEDGGLTWGEPETVVEDMAQQGVHYVPVAFQQHGDAAYAYVTQMKGHDRPIGYICLRYGNGTWKTVRQYTEPVLFNTQPTHFNGRLIASGRMAPVPGELPLLPIVMFAEDDAPANWQIVPMPGPWLQGDMRLDYPETTFLLGKEQITLLARNDAGPVQLFESRNAGQTWSGPFDSSIPSCPSKMYAGELSDGRQYLIYNDCTNTFGRTRLVIALRKAYDLPFEKTYTLFEGWNDELRAGPWWHYPCAVEWNGMLLVTCSASTPSTNIRHAALARIPLSSL